MPLRLSDTSPAMEEKQISMIRKAGIAERLRRMRSLSRTVIRLSRRAISRAHPSLSQQEIDLIFISLHYGEEIAGRLKTYLQRKEP
jgi:hypothetical protein